MSAWAQMKSTVRAVPRVWPLVKIGSTHIAILHVNKVVFVNRDI
jgi:hypothetical protein